LQYGAPTSGKKSFCLGTPGAHRGSVKLALHAALLVTMDRIAILEETLKTQPNEPFIRYALAMEFANAGQFDKALEQFDYLLSQHPKYGATYYQAGAFLARQGQYVKARKVLERGVQVAREQGNSHALDELQAALQELPNS
jgi:tetratricopeptide (TPR) repeat protein